MAKLLRRILRNRLRLQSVSSSRSFGVAPMFKDSSEVLKYIKDEDIKFLDIRFTDLPGVQQHFNIPASSVDEEFFSVGQLFDGSSIRGFANIHESDMQVIPDRKSKSLNSRHASI